MNFRAFRHVVQFGYCKNWTFFPAFVLRFTLAFAFTAIHTLRAAPLGK